MVSEYDLKMAQRLGIDPMLVLLQSALMELRFAVPSACNAIDALGFKMMKRYIKGCAEPLCDACQLTFEQFHEQSNRVCGTEGCAGPVSDEDYLLFAAYSAVLLENFPTYKAELWEMMQAITEARSQS